MKTIDDIKQDIWRFHLAESYYNSGGDNYAYALRTLCLEQHEAIISLYERLDALQARVEKLEDLNNLKGKSYERLD